MGATDKSPPQVSFHGVRLTGCSRGRNICDTLGAARVSDDRQQTKATDRQTSPLRKTVAFVAGV